MWDGANKVLCAEVSPRGSASRERKSSKRHEVWQKAVEAAPGVQGSQRGCIHGASAHRRREERMGR
eukprot:364319-Chlamydomonas_euryale.AAC.3